MNEHQNDTGGVNDWSPVIAKMCKVLRISTDGPKGSGHRIYKMWKKLKGPKGNGGYRAKSMSDEWVVVESN